jgi:DNA polymerase-1
MQKIVLIDGYGFVFRAYHSLPPLTRSDGTPVGAVYGFINMLIKLISTLDTTHIAVIFDAGGKNFRHQLFAEYKANRPPCPPDLIPQFALIRQAVEALNIVSIEKNGYEADDIIATISQQAKNQDFEVMIVSSDKDLMQLVDDKVQLYDAMKNKLINDSAVYEKFSVQPKLVLDMLALIGDSSDNIPGVKGIGPKTAAELLLQFGNLENLLNNIDQIKSDRKKQLILQGKEDAILSKKLASLDYQVPLDYQLNQLALQKIIVNKLVDFLQEQGFRSLLNKIKQEYANSNTNNDRCQVYYIQNDTDLNNLLNDAEKLGCLAIDQQQDKFFLVPFSPYVKNFQVFCCNHQYWQQISSSNARKIFFSSKNFINNNTNFDDIVLIYHLLNPALHKINSQNLDQTLLEMVQNYLNDNSYNILQQNNEDAFATRVIVICKLYQILQPQLLQQQLSNVYFNYELPLIAVLQQIQGNGILLNKQAILQLGNEFSMTIEQLGSQIYQVADEQFNINSPAQLANILYNKLRLPNNKNNSTSADILTELDHPICDLILQFRKITKLKNTYADTLPQQINPQTNRIHTTFSSTSTITGRLTSSNPNLQNIPNKSQEGKKIRACFVAKSGFKLLSADYSQIELRVLAHLANIDSLITAFKQQQDIHRITAQQIFSQNNISDEQRNQAKAINFGIIYGLSAFGLAKQLNISKQQATDYIANYFAQYPGIGDYIEQTIAFASQNQFVKTIAGRKCQILGINSSNKIEQTQAKRQAINAPIQGSASDIIKKAMILVHNKLMADKMQSRILLQVHDELLLEVPEDEIAMVESLVKTTMEQSFNLKVPLVVDLEVSYQWL